MPTLTGSNVKAFRERYGTTAAEFARLFGVTERTIYNWESGFCRVDPLAELVIMLVTNDGEKGLLWERLCDMRNHLEALERNRARRKVKA